MSGDRVISALARFQSQLAPSRACKGSCAQTGDLFGEAHARDLFQLRSGRLSPNGAGFRDDASEGSKLRYYAEFLA